MHAETECAQGTAIREVSLSLARASWDRNGERRLIRYRVKPKSLFAQTAGKSAAGGGIDEVVGRKEKGVGE